MLDEYRQHVILIVNNLYWFRWNLKTRKWIFLLTWTPPPHSSIWKSTVKTNSSRYVLAQDSGVFSSPELVLSNLLFLRRATWPMGLLFLIKEQIRKHVTPSTKAKMFSFLSFISRMCINLYLIFKKTQNSDLWLSWLYNVFCQHYSCQKELEQACTNWDSLEQWYVLCAVLVLMSLNIIF